LDANGEGRRNRRARGKAVASDKSKEPSSDGSINGKTCEKVDEKVDAKGARKEKAFNPAELKAF
jgi:hypothetical protein